MKHKDIVIFYRDNKEVVDELINKIYLSVYTPVLSNHDDFSEAINLGREEAKLLFYIAMYSMNYKEDTPWVVKQYYKECDYSYNLSKLLVKNDILTKVNCEILEDQARDITYLSEERRLNAKKRLQSLRSSQGDAVVLNTQA